MMDRRSFLRRTSIALAGGLILGDAAMELFERLTYTRTLFPSAEIHRWPLGIADMMVSSSVYKLDTTTLPLWGCAPSSDYWLRTAPRFAESWRV